MARFAFQVNETTENIGARRLHTIMEKVLDEISFHAPDLVKPRAGRSRLAPERSRPTSPRCIERTTDKGATEKVLIVTARVCRSSRSPAS